MTHRVGNIVSFVHSGVTFTGLIEKVNKVTLGIRLTEDSTLNGKVYHKGQKVNASKSLVPDGTTPATHKAPKPRPEPPKYNPFTHVDNYILAAISIVYHQLSPENLTCDGELRGHALYAKEANLKHKLRHLCEAYGQDLDEEDIYAWEASREEWHATHPEAAKLLA